jgi:hypothetical protein
MKTLFSKITAIWALAGVVLSCTTDAGRFSVVFDNTKEVSGKKFAIHDISPGLPADWDAYNYVVLEFRCTTAQRFHVGFTTADGGYNELRIMNYTPGAWNRLAIPLRFYRELPGSAVDLAATYNQPRYTGWINLGGKRGALHGVDSIGFRMRVPVGQPELEIRAIALAVDDPGDAYLGDEPAVDEFGQWNLGEWEGKVASLEQLRDEWAAEDREPVSTEAYQYSKYGGYLQARTAATGFFRTERIDGRWWFVDPEGYLFLSVGVDCVRAGGGGDARDVDRRRNMFKTLPPDDLANPSRRGNPVASFGRWNLQRRYGDNFRAKANEAIIDRMDRWGLNTIANWSDGDVMALNRKAFIQQLQGVGINSGLMGLTDVYDDDFPRTAEAAIRDFTAPQRDNPWLIGYFLGNEPAWLGQEERLCAMIIEGADRPIKTALAQYLARGGDTPARRKAFIYDTFATFLQTIRQLLTQYDPNHLNLGMRFGNGHLDEAILDICKRSFDVFSFNCYELKPDVEMMDRTMRLTGLPLIIGEYHFGTTDRGMAQSLWQVGSQAERGTAYRYYTEHAYAHPGLVGTAYFQWCDQDLTGRFDGENYNCGLVDVTDRPYAHQVAAMAETAKRLFAVHSGTTAPVDRAPERARGHGAIPDVWE